MATVADRILELLKGGVALDDDQIASQLGIVRQQVNQVARRLDREGRLVRRRGSSGKIVNQLGSPGAAPSAAQVRRITSRSLLTGDGYDDWQSFEMYARWYFSDLWGVDLHPNSVDVAGKVPWNFDLVSRDGRYVGDAKWMRNIPVPAGKWATIAEYIWLLQKVEADRVFMVFGQDADVAERFLARVRALTEPVEFYFLDRSGHRQI